MLVLGGGGGHIVTNVARIRNQSLRVFSYQLRFRSKTLMVRRRYLASFPLGSPSENGITMAHAMKCTTDTLTKDNSSEKFTDLYSLPNFAFQADFSLSEEYAKADERD